MKQIRKAFLIVPPTGRYIREDRCQTPIEEFTTIAPRPPIGLLYVGGVLEAEGVECRAADYPTENRGWDDFRREFAEFMPDLLVLDVTTQTLARDMEACRIARELNPDCLTMAKGAIFRARDEESLEDYPELDIVPHDEYEPAVQDLARGVAFAQIPGITYRENGRVHRNEDRPRIDDLDKIPYPARHLLNVHNYFRPDLGVPQTTVITSRGCPYECIYCLSRLVSGTKHRRRSPENIVGELRECYERHGIRDFLFWSDTFSLQKGWAHEVCDAIIESKLPVRWASNSRVDSVDEKLLRHMKEAGCWIISFGTEAGSDEMLQNLKKGGKATIQQAKDTLALCRKVGIKSSCYFLIGLPWETRETFEETVQFAVDLSPDFVEFFYAYPFPGTEFHDKAVEFGLLKPGEVPLPSYARPAIPTLHLGMEELADLRRQALRRFYLRPGYIARTLLSNPSPRTVGNYVKYGVRQLKDLMQPKTATNGTAATPEKIEAR